MGKLLQSLTSGGRRRGFAIPQPAQRDASFQHHYMKVRGVRLHWAELGKSDGRPPLVLLHGLFDSHLTWRSVAMELGPGRRVLMPDLPGCGLSERPDASYELSWHAEIIAAWLRMLGLDEVDVVGHSFGGGVAQMLLLERPMPMRRLVLVAAGGLGRDVGFWLRLASVPWVIEYLGQPFMARGTGFALGMARHALSKDYVTELSAMNGARGSARAFSRTLRHVIDWRGQRQLFFERSGEVQLPSTALFWGDRDPVIPIAHGHAFVSGFRGITFKRFEGCGHYPHQQQPGPFAVALEAFLDDPSVPGTHAPVPRHAAEAPGQCRRRRAVAAASGTRRVQRLAP